MKAVTYQGAKDVEVKEVENAKIEKADDILVRITTTAICGSDLHIYRGALPARKDYVIGHEPMGIIEEVGPSVTNVKKATESLYHSMFLVGNAFTANMTWKVNATVPMKTQL